MKSAKTFIILTFLLAFVFQISAQDKVPKIAWKNLQQSYESFYEIKPSIINVSEKPLYYRNNWNVSFEYFDKDKNLWQENLTWGGCLPTKEKTWKLVHNSQVEIFEKRKDFFNWYGILCCDVVFNDFIAKNQTIKYRLVVSYYYGKRNSDSWIYSYSPEFEVTVKDFKKYFL